MAVSSHVQSVCRSLVALISMPQQSSTWTLYRQASLHSISVHKLCTLWWRGTELIALVLSKRYAHKCFEWKRTYLAVVQHVCSP